MISQRVLHILLQNQRWLGFIRCLSLEIALKDLIDGCIRIGMGCTSRSQCGLRLLLMNAYGLSVWVLLYGVGWLTLVDFTNKDTLVVECSHTR